MKITGAQIGSIFIIVIMLASVIGVSFSSWGKDKAAVPDANMAATAIKDVYSADVNGIITEKTTDILITADTNELDITKLDAQLTDINNVKTIISSQYNTDSNKIIYIANLRLKEKDYDYTFVEALNNVFSSYQLYPTQLFSFTNPIHLVSKDSNNIIDYDLGYTQMKIITESTTQEKDNITARFDVATTNDIPTQIFAYEILNISAQPISFVNIEEKEIFDLNEYTILSSEQSFDTNLLKNYFTDYRVVTDNDTNNQKIETKDDINTISAFIEDYNSFKGTKTAKIYVDSLSYLDQNYSYDNNVDVSVSYDKTNTDTLNIGGYIYRNELVQVFAYE